MTQSPREQHLCWVLLVTQILLNATRKGVVLGDKHQNTHWRPVQMLEPLNSYFGETRVSKHIPEVTCDLNLLKSFIL